MPLPFLSEAATLIRWWEPDAGRCTVSDARFPTCIGRSAAAGRSGDSASSGLGLDPEPDCSPGQCRAIAAMDDVLDRFHDAPETFLERVGADQGERVGTGPPVLDPGRNAEPRASRRHRQQRSARPHHRAHAPELAGLEAMHTHLTAQMRLAVLMFMTEGLQLAMRPAEEEECFRDRERAVVAGPYTRLQEGGEDRRPAGCIPTRFVSSNASRSCWRQWPPAARGRQPSATKPACILATLDQVDRRSDRHGTPGGFGPLP